MQHFVRRSTRSRNPVHEVEYVVTDRDMLDNEFVRCTEQENFPNATGYLWWHAAKECEACEQLGLPCYYYAPRLKKNGSSKGHLDRCYRCRQSNSACHAESTAQRHRYLHISNLKGQPNVAPTQTEGPVATRHDGTADPVATHQDNVALNHGADVEMDASGSGGQNAELARQRQRKRRRLNHTPPSTHDEAESSDAAPHSSSADPPSPSAHLASPQSLANDDPERNESADIDCEVAVAISRSPLPLLSGSDVAAREPSLPAVPSPPQNLPQPSPADAIASARSRSSFAYSDSEESGLDSILAEFNREAEAEAAVPGSPSSDISLETSGDSPDFDPDPARVALDPDVSGAIEPPIDDSQSQSRSPRTPSAVVPAAFRIGSSSFGLLGIPFVDVRAASTFDAPIADDHMHLRVQAGDLVTVIQRNEQHRLVLAIHEDGRPGWVPMADLHLDGVDLSALPEAPSLIVDMNDDLTRELHVRLEGSRRRRMADLRAKQGELAARDAEVARLQARLADRDAEVGRLQDKLAGRDAEVAQLQEEADSTTKETKALSAKLGREQALNAAHVMRIANLHDLKAMQEKELSAAKDADLALRDHLSAKKDELRQVKTQLNDVQAAKNAVSLKLEARNAEFAKQGTRLASRVRRLSAVEGELASMKRALDAYESQLAAAERKLAIKSDEAEANDHFLSLSETQLKEVEKAKDDVCVLLEASKAKLGVRSRKIGVLEGKLKAERAAHADISLQLEAAKTELTRRDQQLADKDGKIGVLEDELKAEQKSRAGIASKLGTATAKLAHQGRKLAGVEDKLKLLQSAKDAISIQLKDRTAELAQRSQQLADKDGQIADLEGKLKATQRELDASKSALAAQERKHGAALKDAQAQRDDARRQLEEKTEELAQIERQLPESALPAIIDERDRAHQLVGVANAERDGAFVALDKANAEKERLAKERDEAVTAKDVAQQTEREECEKLVKLEGQITVLEKQLAAVQELLSDKELFRKENIAWDNWYVDTFGGGAAEALVELSHGLGGRRLERPSSTRGCGG